MAYPWRSPVITAIHRPQFGWGEDNNEILEGLKLMHRAWQETRLEMAEEEEEDEGTQSDEETAMLRHRPAVVAVAAARALGTAEQLDDTGTANPLVHQSAQGGATTPTGMAFSSTQGGHVAELGEIEVSSGGQGGSTVPFPKPPLPPRRHANGAGGAAHQARKSRVV